MRSPPKYISHGIELQFSNAFNYEKTEEKDYLTLVQSRRLYAAIQAYAEIGTVKKLSRIFLYFIMRQGAAGFESYLSLIPFLLESAYNQPTPCNPSVIIVRNTARLSALIYDTTVTL
ncbi:MAG TPA: hypothetical protein VFM61_09690, partial [Pseudidiomarina sp.]|nr:hypothetical protein [Pseudidiomarina sp.]